MLSSAELTPMGNVEARALENARELDAIFQTTLTAVYLGEAVFDKSHQVVDMRFLRVNQTFTSITGWSENDLLTKSLLTISPDTLHTQFLRQLNHVLTTGEAIQDTLHYPHLGRWFEFSMARMDVNKVTVSFFEVTTLKRKEAELEQTIE